MRPRDRGERGSRVPFVLLYALFKSQADRWARFFVWLHVSVFYSYEGKPLRHDLITVYGMSQLFTTGLLNFFIMVFGGYELLHTYQVFILRDTSQLEIYSACPAVEVDELELTRPHRTVLRFIRRKIN